MAFFSADNQNDQCADLVEVSFLTFSEAPWQELR